MPESPPVRGAPRAGVTIRDLQWDDLDAMVETYYALYDERDRGEPIGIHLFAVRPSRSDEVGWFTSLYRRVLANDAVVAVAEVDGRAVGHCTIATVGLEHGSETDHVGLLGIVVAEAYRGRGVGRALMLGALERARGRFEIVLLDVFSNNHRARHLYEEIGFQVRGKLPFHAKRGGDYFDADEMWLDLRRWTPPTANG